MSRTNVVLLSFLVVSMFCVVGTLDAQPARQVASRNLPNVLFIAVDDLNEWHGTNHAIRSEKYNYIRYDDGVKSFTM